jgi:hypothetical protein
MEVIMTEKSKFGFGKRRKRMKAGDKPRKDEQQDRHRRERHPSNKESGGDSYRMAMALLCASAGLPVVPLHGFRDSLCTCGNEHCEQPGRHPHTKAATTDLARIEKYWTKWPKAKIGVVLGTKSGVIALVTEGSAGKKTLRDLEEKTE